MSNLLKIIKESLFQISNPRFYETERGYQGELATEISKRLPQINIDGAIVEQEYQKRIKEHGFQIRPDIILHIPYEQSALDSRDEGNFAIIELKLRSTMAEALDDYRKMLLMCNALYYPLAVFVNIDSDVSYFGDFEGADDPRIFGFAVKLDEGSVKVF